MTERKPTSDQLYDLLLHCLECHDMEGAVHSLRVMATVDPRRADQLLKAVEVGIALRSENR